MIWLLKSHWGYVTLLIYGIAGLVSFQQSPNRLAHWVTLLALCSHAFLLHQWIDLPEGQNLGLTNVISLLAWFMTLLIWMGSLKTPFKTLLLGQMTLSAISIGLVILIPTRWTVQTHVSHQGLLHILLSLAALSTWILCGIQAACVQWQNTLLKQNALSASLALFPPLETMETFLFQSIRFGFLLLSFSLISTCFFSFDLLYQHKEKIMLSVSAWTLMAIVLFQHHKVGLRGKKATEWILICTGLITMTFFTGRLLHY